MRAIYKREVRAYFTSPLAYVFLFVSMLVSGFFFYITSILYGTSNLSSYFTNWTFVFMIFVPILTMRLMAEDRRNKTDQLYITAPVSIWSVVVGKFLAAMTVVMTAIVLSLVNVVIVAIFGQVEYSEVLCTYIGFILQCAAFVSIGVLISSLTESQVIAAVLTMAVFFVVQYIQVVSSWVDNPVLINIFNYISFYMQMSEFSSGLLNVAPVLFFLSVTVICLFLTVRAVEKRRWS